MLVRHLQADYRHYSARRTCLVKMTRLIREIALLCIAFAVSSATLPAAEPSYAEDEVFVRFEERASNTRIRNIERRYQLARVQEFAHIRFVHYRLLEGTDLARMMRQLSHEPGVSYVEPNYLSSTQTTPTDPDFDNLWALHNTGQIVNGVTGTADVDIDWTEALGRFVMDETANVIVAVIDSGISLDHPDIIGATWTNDNDITFDDGVDDDENGFVDDFVGWDFYDNDNLPLDENGHGTLVASIIAGEMNNDVPGVGAAPGAQIMALRAADDFGSLGFPIIANSNVIGASTYAAGSGARIINASFGGPAYSASVEAQIEWLDAQGVLFVAAAGNSGQDNDAYPIYPASYATGNIISVAAVDQSGGLATFSNFGARTVDIAAPGTNIFGADISRSVVYLDDFESGAPGWTQGHLAGSQSSLPWSLFVDASGNTWVTDSTHPSGHAINYQANTNAWVQSPPIDLSGAVGPQLSVDIWYQLESGYDYVVGEISTDAGVTWDAFTWPLSGSLSIFTAPETRQFDLSPWEGLEVSIRARIKTDSIVNYDGVYIDNFRITEVDFLEYDGSQHQFNNGTSFAAPLVAGVAALVLLQRPDLTHRQVREIILGSADRVSALDGSIATGGRLNAERSLAATEAVPLKDSDGDGVPDRDDAFPNDPRESSDNDGDGIGDGADLDDDNDEMPDVFESAHGLDPTTPDGSLDPDADGYSNLEEFEEGTDPNDTESFPHKRTTHSIEAVLQLLLD